MRAVRVTFGILLAGIAAISLISAASSLAHNPYGWNTNDAEFAGAIGVMAVIGSVLLLKRKS